jgi:glutathione S-transferase
MALAIVACAAEPPSRRLDWPHALNRRQTMITLCGFSVSNYYNKVKMVLLEKGVPFEEEVCKTGSKDEAVLACSPLAKIPFIRTEHGALCESQAIVDYIEATHPQPPLIPADPWQAAKVHELITFVDLHLEIVARELYPQAFFGSDANSPRPTSHASARSSRRTSPASSASRSSRPMSRRHVHAGRLRRLVQPAAGVAGDQDVYGEDLLAAGGIDWKPYSKMIGERPSAQRVLADRKASQAGVGRTSDPAVAAGDEHRRERQGDPER